jgi:hypothetical protein
MNNQPTINLDKVSAQAWAEGVYSEIAKDIEIVASRATNMTLGQLMKESELAWHDVVKCSDCGDQAGMLCAMLIAHDLVLTTAASPARNWREAVEKVEFLAEHRNAVRRGRPTLAVILNAIIERECEQWDIALIDLSEPDKDATQH